MNVITLDYILTNVIIYVALVAVVATTLTLRSWSS